MSGQRVRVGISEMRILGINSFGEGRIRGAMTRRAAEKSFSFA
jgi:hypothetical protein